ncbi:MAG: hypothetical protein OM95_00250 [Bdellovibrio sp. ArHS]|uniref:lipopolysaccharide biosynthesis protein n=1 Tax=Bdellovibrio sp. ArHS TaxID=1569284 RepID=UPI000583576C|nr:hypothetical protein [Bdellovibrio sp. ArHS]KHD89995.1 MAG: hypothetical protein OM95_00250 [Bdellovibrio sp. ArHS]
MKMSEGSRKSVFSVVMFDAAVTFISEIVILVSFFLFYRLVSEQFSKEVVGIYSLLRRALAIFFPLAMVGLAEGLGKYVAMAKTPDESKKIISSSALILAAVLAIVFFVFQVNLEASAKVIFGDKEFSQYVLPFLVLLVGTCIHTFFYSCLRGSLNIKLANLLQLLNIGLLPIVVMLSHDYRNLGDALFLIGGAQAVIALVFGLISLKIMTYRMNHISVQTVGQMLVYGFPRVPAPLAAAGLISIGPMIASHFLSIVETGYLSLCLTLLVGIGGALSPIGVVLLPHVSKLITEGHSGKIEKRLHILVGAMVQILLFTSIQVIIFSDLILKVWMGSDFADAAPVLILVFMSLNAYGFYVVVRNIIDAVSVKPFNSINSVLSLLCLVISFYVIAHFWPGNLILKFAFAIMVSINVLGFLTYRTLKKITSYNSKEDLVHLRVAFFLNLVVLLVSYYLKQYIGDHLIAWVLYELLIGVLYLFILWKMKFEWIVLIVSNVLKKVGLRNVGGV